jgi:hypothetical protein
VTTIHIPNDTTQATRETIEASQPGDTLIFDAGTCALDTTLHIKNLKRKTYTFDTTLHIKNDRRYLIVNQIIEASDSFHGECLIEFEDNAEEYIITGCLIDGRGKCTYPFLGNSSKGLLLDLLIK